MLILSHFHCCCLSYYWPYIEVVQQIVLKLIKLFFRRCIGPSKLKETPPFQCPNWLHLYSLSIYQRQQTMLCVRQNLYTPRCMLLVDTKWLQLFMEGYLNLLWHLGVFEDVKIVANEMLFDVNNTFTPWK